MKIYEKLLEIQKELKAPKKQFNKFGNYYFRNCEDILEALKPHLEKNKCALVIKDSIEHIGDRYYIKAIVELIDIETGEKVESSALAREEETKKGMDSSQLTGSTSSYARKYALNGMYSIDDTKDADTQNNHKEEDKSQEDDLDKKFLEYWNSLSDDKRAKLGEKYPNKYGSPQLNPQYFKKSEKEEILKKVKEAKKNKGA